MSSEYRWLLEIDGAGPTRRWSTEDLEVYDNAGNAYVYRAGLADLEVAASDVDIDVGIVDETDWPRLAGVLHGTAVTLRRWRLGSVLDVAVVYARGRVDDLDYGARGEPVSFTIGDERHVDIPPMPDLGAKVSPETFPLADSSGFIANEAAFESYYPIVFGNPGHLEEDGQAFPLSTVWVVPVPIPQVGDSPQPGFTFEPHYVVAEDAATCAASSVWLATLGGDAGPVAILFESNTAIVTDELGRTILTANAGPNGEALPDAESRVYAGYPPAAGSIRSLYDVLAYACARWAPDSTDFAKLREAEGDLSRFLVDTWISESVAGGLWAWVEALIEFLPFEIRTGGFGRYLIRKRATVDATLTRRVLDASAADIVRASSVSYSGDPFSAISVLYADLGEHYHTPFLGKMTYGPAAGVEPVSYRNARLQEVRAHGLLAASLARYGARSLEVELPWTWDRPTAALVAEWQIERGAIPHRRVSYIVPERWGLVEGDQVEIVDEDVKLSHLAIIDEPPIASADGMTIVLRIPGDSYGG